MSAIFNRLISLNSFDMSYDHLNLNSINKINSTVQYSINNNPNQDITHVTKRCRIATMAEQQVAFHMNGQIMNNEIDFNDPFTYAFDVLSGIDYYGARIEVKTHQSNSKWISVNIDEKNYLGHLNLYHFLNYEVADYIVIYKTTLSFSNYNFKKVFVGNRKDIKKIIKKSKYKGWYLNI